MNSTMTWLVDSVNELSRWTQTIFAPWRPPALYCWNLMILRMLNRLGIYQTLPGILDDDFNQITILHVGPKRTIGSISGKVPFRIKVN